jgi:hypothetical protein
MCVELSLRTLDLGMHFTCHLLVDEGQDLAAINNDVGRIQVVVHKSEMRIIVAIE